MLILALEGVGRGGGDEIEVGAVSQSLSLRPQTASLVSGFSEVKIICACALSP